MPSTSDGELGFEKTPSYFPTTEVPERMFKLHPNVKLILGVKEPVHRRVLDIKHNRSYFGQGVQIGKYTQIRS